MNEERIEMLTKAGLNWKVNSEPIQTVSGILIPDRMALVREDTNKVLGIHTPNYSPYQNDELLELLYRISGQTGLQVHTGGCFKGGEKVFFQLKSADLKLGNDKIEGYISGLNSFSGVCSLAFGTSKTTISCMNSFWTAYREVTSRIRHSSDMRLKIEEILQHVDLLLKEEQLQFAEIKRLSETPMSPEIRELITKRFFEISIEERLDNPEFSTRKKNQIATFNRDMEIEISGKGETLWSLFSGCTRYSTHSMRHGKNEEAKMFGRVGVIERQIYNELVEMV